MSRLLPIVFGALLTVAACAPPRQVIRVTERATGETPSTGIEEPVETKPSTPETTSSRPDQVAGRFDGGKMWTFDDPPLDWFREAYDLEPDSSWFARARGGALRFSTYCSASFVSPHGLVMTNHHCARESVTKVSRPGESLLDAGFYAQGMDDERKVDGLFVEQLVDIRDITEDVYDAASGARTDMARAAARRTRAEAIETRLTAQAEARDSSLSVQVLALYDGGRYAAYTFRRFDDVRLVQAPELQIGFYGGDWDNFTYPRYNLDMAFFRVYGDDGKPHRPDHWFAVDPSGAEVDEAVFVIGNPGSTSRLNTVTQLEYERDLSLPLELEVLEKRADILAAYIDAYPDSAETYDLRNAWFSLRNTIKATRGQLNGLRSDWLIPRRAAAQAELLRLIATSDSLRGLYASVLDDIRAIDRAKRASTGSAAGFTYFTGLDMSSHVLVRALYGYVYTLLKQRGAPEDQLEEIKEEALGIDDWPLDVEKEFIRVRLEELRAALGETDPTVRRLFAKESAVDIAARVADSTAIADSAGFAALMDGSYLSSGDVSVELIEAIAPLFFTLSQQLQSFEEQEGAQNARLARARFATYGTTVPPDASFSLRIADGRVRGYEYNGTGAPAFTTFFGMYDRFHSLGHLPDWTLPDRWIGPPTELDLATRMNLVSTNDITGGNSGSPLLDRELRVVGLVFDSNIEALPNKYLFTERAARTISVDIRGVLEALDTVYDADRVVAELLDHRFYASESEADAAASN